MIDADCNNILYSAVKWRISRDVNHSLDNTTDTSIINSQWLLLHRRVYHYLISMKDSIAAEQCSSETIYRDTFTTIEKASSFDVCGFEYFQFLKGGCCLSFTRRE